MKLPSISVAFALAAGLVSAAPIRVFIISTSQRVAPANAAPAWAQSIRWGHAAAPAFNSLPPLNQATQPHDSMVPHWMSGKSWASVKFVGSKMQSPNGGCHGGMRVKALQMGNRLRVMLGLAPIIPHLHEAKKIQTETISQPTRYRNHHVHHHMHEQSFMYRLSHALMMLGPWEGRALSFVLGCGLGAILRMLFVFGVLIVRSMRCQRQQQPIALEEDTVIFVADIKEPIVVEALPAYADKTDEVPQGPNAVN
ncbi:putative transmembrane protein [Rhizoctonia solani 123E]|uniref:Putative transmembrane protein n=1 Tax=Rhizoctonia solani 123E TaxID=1423351 RepID=A0A074SCR7_9AGAM|nr:putative transmembrane protein [Rhizoctonia solani 123E]